MTMAGYDALYLLTLLTVAFGALSFSVLALFYWRERRSRPRTAFTAFTEVCAAAFLINLLLRITPRWETPLTLCLDLITSLVPPLLAPYRDPREAGARCWLRSTASARCWHSLPRSTIWTLPLCLFVINFRSSCWARPAQPVYSSLE